MRIVRDFAHPRIELLRLLREAAEIEHSLMIQYLYAAFSVKPAYREMVGMGNPNTDDLLGVAIQEMQHLADVNTLLVEIGATPVLARQDFPYEPDIYPFALDLEPLSRKSLAKYAYCEAPVAALDRRRAKSAEDLHFIDEMDAVLGSATRPNHVGSLYDRVIETLKEFARHSGEIKDLDKWLVRLEHIKDEGEDGHFKLFKELFMGTHRSMRDCRDIWGLAKDHPDYPALDLPTNPSAYLGHENQIRDPETLALAWLGNLHYWLFLTMLDVAYRRKSERHRNAAKTLMMGPFWSLARHLPTRGVGMPYDQLSLGYAASLDEHSCLASMTAMADEIQGLEQRLKATLPEDYPTRAIRQAMRLFA